MWRAEEPNKAMNADIPVNDMCAACATEAARSEVSTQPPWRALVWTSVVIQV